ncbi:MAG: glycerol acyltransferase [Chlorobi bacterium]|nr:glycerol acyltransferase [Chlorobiota bacterium]
MKKLIGRLILKLAGWKLRVPPEYRIKKGVMVGAPHTSNWDILYTLAGMWAAEYRPKFFIKKEWIDKPVIGAVLKWLGGIPVDRSKRNNLVEHSVELLRQSDELILLVPAEGTRSRVKEWKKGFYHIARKANLPVILAYLDYKKKEAGVGKIMHLTGDFYKDMEEIEAFYKNVTPKYPEKYNPKIFIRPHEKSSDE